jgi:methylglutaconyl-CoA hydratase
MTTTIQVRRVDGVDFVTLNRPEVRNAFNDELIAEMTAWAARAAGDRALRAVVIAGGGPTFCAGADLEWMQKMARQTRDENLRDARAAVEMFSAIDTLPVPVIARIHGAALGGGTGLAAVADIAVAASDAVFGFTEVKLGLIPSIIGPYVLAKIGQSAARALFVTGRRFDAAHARAIGLVHTVVGPEQLDDTVNTYVKELASNGREAMGAAKALIRRIANHPIDEVMSITADAIAERRASSEAQQRIAAFLKKQG